MRWLFCFFALFSTCLWAEKATPTPAETKVIQEMDLGEPTLLRIWPKGSEHNASRSDKPELTELEGRKIKYRNTGDTSLMVFGPAKGVKSNGVGLVFCPGGGYGLLSMWPPSQMVEWFTHLGGTVAILKYHVPRSSDDPHHVVPLRDAQRALRVMRSKASELGLDVNKIGIAGSSAGGHLAFNTTLSHQKNAYETIDGIDALSARPDFTILFYPAYLGHNMTLGAGLNYDALDKKTTPPIFITGASDDKHLAGTFAALPKIKAAKVPCEAHVFNHGGHGGMFDKYPMLEYARTCICFLSRQGIFDADLVTKSDAWLEQKRSEVKAQSKKAAGVLSVQAPESLPMAEYSLFEKDVQTRYQKDLMVYRLWPGEGTRDDDPLSADQEDLKERNVPVATNVTKPSMLFFPAAKPNGRAVVVLPGGGYGVLAYEHEGTMVADWLNQQGISAFVLKYRTPRRANLDKHHVALQDVQRAIRLVRSQAKAFGVDPNKIGTLGFSAGGHLSALAGKDFAQASYESIDSYDKVDFKSNFTILIYPAYTTTEINGTLLDPIFALKKQDRVVPTFLATAIDDKWTHGMFYLMNEFHREKFKMESHIYENGGHGKGILNTDFSFSQWTIDCERWLKDLSEKN